MRRYDSVLRSNWVLRPGSVIRRVGRLFFWLELIAALSTDAHRPDKHCHRPFCREVSSGQIMSSQIVSGQIPSGQIPSGQIPSGQIVINEFLPSPTGGQEEFIELLNAGGTPVSIAEISFRDARAEWTAIAPDSPRKLDPGDMLVLAAGDPPAWPGIEFVRPSRWPSLNNSGDSLAVRVEYVVTDRVGYSQNERGRSLERIDPAVPGHLAANWAPSGDSSGGTPGQTNSRYRPDVIPPRLLAAEFDPPATLFLWMSEPIDPASLGNIRLEIDGNNAVSFEVAPAPFRLEVTHESILDPVSVTAGGLTDYAGHPMPDTSLYVAMPVSPGDVLLTELLVESRPGPDDLPEFVELVSVAEHPVSLRQANLTIGAGPEPDVIFFCEADSTRILNPGEILLVYASPASDVAAAHTRSLIKSNLPSGQKRIVLVSADASDLTLRNAGDLIRLVTGDGLMVDSAAYGPHLNDSRFQDHAGRSIHRVTGNVSEIQKWVSTLGERAATPGSTDAAPDSGSRPQPGDLVFSELMPRPLSDPMDGRSDQPEYVEIANVSNRTISLNGLLLAGPVLDDGSTHARRIGFQPLRLEPNGVALFYELPNSVGDRQADQFAALTDAFPAAYPRGIEFGQQQASLGHGDILTGGRGLLVPLRGAISLKDDGETLRLLGPDGAGIDSISFSPAMHHPAVSDPTGRSLERTVLSPAPLGLGEWSTSTFPGGGSPGLLPRRPGPPPASPDSGPVVRLGPKTISPNGDGVDDRTVILAESLERGTVFRADIFDIDGRLIRTLVPGAITEGTFSVEWSGLDGARRPVARGFYVVLVRTSDADSGHERTFRLPVAVVR